MHIGHIHDISLPVPGKSQWPHQLMTHIRHVNKGIASILYCSVEIVIRKNVRSLLFCSNITLFRCLAYIFRTSMFLLLTDIFHKHNSILGHDSWVCINFSKSIIEQARPANISLNSGSFKGQLPHSKKILHSGFC